MQTRDLEPAIAERALQLSLFDGVAFAAMVGVAETYFIAAAIHLGASPIEIAATVGVPLLCGALGPWLALRLLPRLRQRRPIVVGGALGQVSVLIVAAVGIGRGTLDATTWIGMLGLYHVCGQAAGAAWSSWYGDLVPVVVRGRWFAHRTRFVHLATFTALLLGGGGLHLCQQALGGARIGFALIFAVGALARAISAALLALSPEPAFGGVQGRRALGRFACTRRGRNALVLLIGGGAFQATVYMSSAFFTPFMLNEIGLDYLQFTIVVGVQVGVKVFALPHWGRLIDRIGARGVYRVAILLCAAVPLPWAFATGFWGVFGAQVMSGFSWAGHEVALFALLLESSRSSNRPQVFALQSTCNAVGQVSGSAAGAWLLLGTGYVGLFVLGVALRMAVALAIPSFVSPVRGRRVEAGPLLLRVVGIRPGPGIVHRPMVPSDQVGPVDPGTR